MHQTGKPFEIENKEIKAFVGMNTMMSYHVLPKTHNYFSIEPDLRIQPILTECMATSLRCANNDEAPDKK